MSLLLLPLLLQGILPTALDHLADARILAFDAGPKDRFGQVVALSGDTLAVAAPNQYGVTYVYVYRRVGPQWSFEAKIGGTEAGDSASMALDGDRIVVGSPNSQSHVGIARVYERSGTTWSETAVLQPTGSNPGVQFFGDCVALDGNRIAVGAPYAAGPIDYCGAAFIFENSGGSWIQTARLTASTPAGFARFGDAVALQGDTLVVGSPKHNPPTMGWTPGGAYVFQFASGSWIEQQLLIGGTVGVLTPDEQGSTLAIDGDLLIVGAAHSNNAFGAALVYARAAGTWALSQTLSSAFPGKGIGAAIAVEGDTIALGAWDTQNPDGPYLGSVSIWKRQANGWRERERLVVPATDVNAAIGASVSISNGLIATGAPFAGSGLSFVGAVYTYDSTASWLGESFCHGDGSGTPCPCGWNTFSQQGPGCQHSAGYAALLIARGSTSIAASDLEIVATRIPPNQPAILIHNALAANGGFGIPFYEGLLCGAGSGSRLGAVASHNGSLVWGSTLPAQVNASVGSAVHFQVYYRDNNWTCGGVANTSNGVRIVFTP